MKKLILFALMAGLTACASETPKTEKPAEPAPIAAASETPKAEVPKPVETKAEPPKTDAKTDTKTEPAAKTAEKPPTPPPAPVVKPDMPAWAAKLASGFYARFETNLGDFTAQLNEKEAPGTVANFSGLADGAKEWTDPKTNKKEKKPYYDGLIFHRIIDGFMIQGGDPTGTGMSGPGFTIKDEYNALRHDKAGVLAMARTGAPDSAGSQFYITVDKQPGLDNKTPPYVVFGQVVEGVDVVLKIGKVRTSPDDRPIEPVTIKKIRTLRVK